MTSLFEFLTLPAVDGSLDDVAAALDGIREEAACRGLPTDDLIAALVAALTPAGEQPRTPWVEPPGPGVTPHQFASNPHARAGLAALLQGAEDLWMTPAETIAVVIKLLAPLGGQGRAAG